MNALCKIADIAVQNLLKKVQDKVQKDVLAAEDFLVVRSSTVSEALESILRSNCFQEERRKEK